MIECLVSAEYYENIASFREKRGHYRLCAKYAINLTVKLIIYAIIINNPNEGSEKPLISSVWIISVRAQHRRKAMRAKLGKHLFGIRNE